VLLIENINHNVFNTMMECMLDRLKRLMNDLFEKVSLIMMDNCAREWCITTMVIYLMVIGYTINLITENILMRTKMCLKECGVIIN